MMAPSSRTLIGLTLAGLLAGACSKFEVTASGVAIQLPTVVANTPSDYDQLHNVVSYGPGLLSGGVPMGRAGLDALADMGVKTIVSVDGAMPDAEYAEELGMRYVHLPISYDEVPEQRRRELAQVLTVFEKPVYMHCHHGRHRSAAALGSAAVTAGLMSYDQVEARMRVSGTSPNYPGLWKSVRECEPLPAAELVADPETFPRVSEVSGLIATMAELDIVYDNLKALRKADWSVPDEHPDLVPGNESSRMHRLFALLVDDPDSKKLPADYQEQLQQAIADTEALDAAVAAGDVVRATELLAVVKKGCNSCHADYRDR